VAILELTMHRQSKLGEEQDLCEDVYAHDHTIENEVETLSVALSDGATMTSFARTWAELITSFFVSGKLESTTFGLMIPILRTIWLTRLPADLPWHSEEKVAQGAGATLLGLRVSRDGLGTAWVATAIGDTCLLRYDGTRVVESFPITDSSGFDNAPSLISSAGHAVIPVPAQTTGTLAEHEVLLIATDALAKYLLEHDSELDPLDLVRDEGRSERFDDLRASGAMKNDDIAFALVRLAP
jgi:hypothetical protein